MAGAALLLLGSCTVWASFLSPHWEIRNTFMKQNCTEDSELVQKLIIAKLAYRCTPYSVKGFRFVLLIILLYMENIRMERKC